MVPLPILESSQIRSGNEAENLPDLYDRWVREMVPAGLPRESNATCDTCVMSTENLLPGVDPRGAFNAHTKCCTYMPVLPNFLIGGVLSDQSAGIVEGRDSLLRRIGDGMVATPLGLPMTASYRMQYETTRSTTFGKSDALLCPHFSSDGSGMCTIWHYRNSVCTTWFCRHMHGEAGAKMWRALRDLLSATEIELAFVCALSLGINVRIALDLAEGNTNQGHADLTRELMPEHAHDYAKRIWAGWVGKEAEYYMGCAEVASSMSWQDVLAACGPRVRARASLFSSAVDRVSTRNTPTKLRVAEFKVSGCNDLGCWVIGYSNNDPLFVEHEVLERLAYFDGVGTTPDVLAAMRAVDGVTLDDDVICRLVEFGVLSDLSRPVRPPHNS